MNHAGSGADTEEGAEGAGRATSHEARRSDDGRRLPVEAAAPNGVARSGRAHAAPGPAARAASPGADTR